VTSYPQWIYYPHRSRPPEWVRSFLSVVEGARPVIDSLEVTGVTSDRALAAFAPGLREHGYTVEASKAKADRIRRPVLFGENGTERVAYEVDAVHDELGIVVEIEAGRGARSNAVYRDLIRASLLVDVRFLALGVMREYRHESGGKLVRVQCFHDTKATLDAVYASGRLQLPFEGVLLFGY
jgi:hypothetical protein